MFKTFSLFICLLFAHPYTRPAPNEADKITGKWISADKKLIVQVYRQDNKYRGKMVWFRDDESKPMDEWTDSKNPDPKLRNRKLLGMDVMENLTYDAGNNSYEKGRIYEAKSGKTWNAAATTDGQVLKVKGYWKFKFIGRTMVFNRVP